MDTSSFFAFLAFVFSVALYVPYTKEVLAGRVKPTLSSWVSWLLMDAAVLTGMIATGEMAWQIIAYLVGTTAVIGASVHKKAAAGWTKLDSTCISIGTLAIALWAVSGDPIVAIVLSLVAITIGSIPFIYNMWREPTREPVLPWALGSIGAIFGVLAIKSWNLTAALGPVWFLALFVLFLLLIFRRFISKG